MHPDPKRPKDWISYRLKWARDGFQDPYSREQQAEFAKCDVMCSGPEHNATATAPANPSYCILPIFHPPQDRRAAPANGYVSADGHRFECVNPTRLHQAYHVVFVIDSSGSMGSGDRIPLANTPVTQLLRTRCNNRYGAVLSALHGFWLSRETAQATAQPRQDAYSVVTFNNSPTTRLANDFTSTTDQLLSRLVQTSASGGTNFNSALAHAQTLIQTHWNSDK
ncbi:von willebrand factor type A domain protein, partial [Rhizoctonia solani AG-3 Rhs1AP]